MFAIVSTSGDNRDDGDVHQDDGDEGYKEIDYLYYKPVYPHTA